MKFEEFNLHEDIMRGITDAGFTEAMPAQERTFKAVLNGKDVTVQSQTGTGKTAAFLISIYQLFKTDAVENKKALIIVPTRELAVQIEEEADVLGKYLDYKTVSIYGGVGYKQQLDRLKEGADFIVGTPGRLLDLEKSNHIDYKDFGILVIDEADRLFDMGFFPDLKKMLRKLTDVEKRRTMLFSATLNTRVLNLAWDQMNEYEEIKIEPDKITVEEICQELYHVAGNEKMKLLLGILKKEKSENVIIFCNTKNKVAEVAKRLEVNGYKTKYLMGDLPQNKRLAVINNMKAGELDVLVATDVAARGLHVDDLSLVVNFDLPEDFENYVHRIGRTARAGKSGRAISLACPKYVYHLPAIESFIGDKISVMIADDELFAEDASEGMRFHNEYADDRSHRDGRGGGQRDGRGGGRRSGKPDRGGKPGGDRERSNQNRNNGKRSDSDRSRSENSQSNDNRSVKKRNDRNQNRSDSNRKEVVRDAVVRAPASRAATPRSDVNRNLNNHNDRNKNDKNRRDDGYRKNISRQNPDIKRPTADAGVEDRIAYYKAKYGEDFKASPEMLKQDTGKKKAKGPRKSGTQKAGGNPRNNAPQRGKAPVKKTPAAAKNVSKEVSKEAPKKGGFFGRLFGKK